MSKSEKPLYAEVAVPLPVKKIFDYLVPPELRAVVRPGMRVRVPFGKRILVGCCVGLKDRSGIPGVRNVLAVVDREAVIDRRMLRLTRWLADYYFCSWGEAIRAACPPLLRRPRRAAPESDTSGEETIDHLSLNPQQDSALRPIREKMEAGAFGVFLLHGITGSGKTEIYLQAADCVLKRGKSVIILVPEIALTPQTIERFRQRFAASVAVLHSRLSAGERLREWERIRQGAARIVIGPRSAVFSPVPVLGLVVIDEEHETSYKQEDTPRYHAREVAIERARLARAVVILGSATPSLESYYRAQRKEYQLIELTERVENKDLPLVTVVDMRREESRRRPAKVFSGALERKIGEVLGRNEQVILFLNRRGFSTFAHCRYCGTVVKCSRCNVALIYHFDREKLVCHYCNRQIAPPSLCPHCRSGYVRYFGLGTQKVESEIKRLYPETKAARMDTDSTSRRGAHARILDDFRHGRTGILVGTQMVAKGHDFSRVTLVGVVAADTALNLPDFRSGERTFSLLTQVAGRSGRGEEKGEVIVQTYTPHHYAIQAAQQHDYRRFYSCEISQRRELDYPPFSHLVKIVLRGRKEETVGRAAEELARLVPLQRGKTAISVLGPAPLPVAKVKDYYRWNVILKSKKVPGILRVLGKCLLEFRKPAGVFLAVDVDPMSML